MPSMTMEQVAQLARDAWGGDAPADGDTGATSKIIIDAVAVAFAESGGDPSKHNAVWPDDSWGLWQINMRGQMGVDRRKQFGIPTNDMLLDPVTNARAAHQVWRDNGKSFKPWTTYTNGAYISHVPAARRAAGNDLGSPPTSDVSTFVGDIANGVLGIAQAVWKAMTWIANPHNWVRTIVVMVGGALVIGALVVIAKPNTTVVEAVAQPIKTAGKAVTG